MTVFPFLAVGYTMKFVAFIFVVSSVLLILLILIQKGKGGGLSGAFGGMGAAGGIFGSKTVNNNTGRRVFDACGCNGEILHANGQQLRGRCGGPADGAFNYRYEYRSNST
jgi:protein translocase SecG subunit